MLKVLCLLHLFYFIISVTCNPIAQLVQSCPGCQPAYNNPAPLPLVVQPSNYNPCPQLATAQNSPQGSFGDTLNQIILNRILANPSFQKVVDPNTKLYNQNGEEIQRQVTGTPNVINNYFIVPPEFFNLNETSIDSVNGAKTDSVKPRRTKFKRKPKIIELESDEDDDVIFVTKKESNRWKQMPTGKKKKKHMSKVVEEDDYDEYQKNVKKKEKENRMRRHKVETGRRKDNITPLTEKELDEHVQETETVRHVKPKQIETKRHKSKIDGPAIQEIIAGPAKFKVTEDAVSDETDELKVPETKNAEKKRRKESDKTLEETYLKNIEIPTDVASSSNKENRNTRASKRKSTKKEPAQIVPPIPDNMRNFFPYMPMGNFHNTNTNYPFNFDQYYQYLNPFGNPNAHKNKKRRNHNRKSDDEKPKQKHVIEIKLKPKKNESTTTTTENPVTEKSDGSKDTINSAELEPVTESIDLEIVTDIPMEIPYAVSPENKDEFSEKESYETFSKLEDLQEHISPVLGEEDVVPTMHSNGIINDYYPVFDKDVYYNMYVENLKTLDDDRYFYETNNEELSRLRRTNDNDDYTAKFQSKEISESQTETNPDINKFNRNDYLDHIAKFSDTEFIKPSKEIERIKVPPKNTRIKSEKVETVFAGSKVAKYGGPSEETAENTSCSEQSSDETKEYVIHVVGKSIGRPEDYY